MNRSHAQYFFTILLLIAFINGLATAFHYKQLFNDGAYWALNIANGSTWHIEYQYFRFSTLLLQTPSVLAAKFTQSLSMTPLLFCLGYFIYPFLTLGTLIYIFRKNEKFDYFYVLILTFFVAIIPNWAFSVSVVNESIVMGWCLISYIIFVEKPKTWAITIFAIFLLFSYEVGIAFYGLAFYLLFREKKLKLLHVLIFSVLGGLQILNVFSKILPQNTHEHFMSSLGASLETPLFRLALASMGIFFLSIFTNSKVKFLLLISATSVAYYTCDRVLGFSVESLGWQSYKNRTWAIPVAIILLLLGYESLRRHRFSFNWYHFAVFCLLSIPPVLLEFKLNQSQIEFNERLNEEIRLNSGCKVLSPQEWSSLLQGHPVATWSFPHLSLVYNKQLTIQTILFTKIYDDQGNSIPMKPCHLKEGAIRVEDQHTYYSIYPLRLNLNGIYQ